MTSAGVGALAGVLSAVVWGGVGGRVAMRVLFLTSNERVRGLTSDDGFEIGVISGATVFLFMFTAFLGAFAGALYGLLRSILKGPTWLIAIAVGVTVAAGAGGGLIVNADGIDFRVLEPLWLAVTLFLLIPGAWGITVVLLTERLLHTRAMFPTPPTGIDDQHGGAIGNLIGWLTLAAVTTLGLIDLTQDLNHLA